MQIAPLKCGFFARKARLKRQRFVCHTERSEVSINSKRVLNSLDFSLTLKMTNPPSLHALNLLSVQGRIKAHFEFNDKLAEFIGICISLSHHERTGK